MEIYFVLDASALSTVLAWNQIIIISAPEITHEVKDFESKLTWIWLLEMEKLIIQDVGEKYIKKLMKSYQNQGMFYVYLFLIKN